MRASGLPQSSCQSNMKQLALGVLQYCQDYDERTCPEWDQINPGGLPMLTPDGKWCQWGFDWRLQPYMKSYQLWMCPSASKTIKASWEADFPNVIDNSWNAWQTTPVFSASYILNGYASGRGQAEFQYPADTMFCADGRWVDLDGTPAHLIRISRRHMDGTVLNYIDGHAKWLNAQSIPNIRFAP